MADLLDPNSDPALIYRRPEAEARLPGYVTIPEAARIVFHLLLPGALSNFGSLDDRHIPGRIKYDGTKPIGVRQRKIAKVDGRSKAVDTFVPLENIVADHAFASFTRLTKRLIFKRILSKNLKYSLIRNGVGVPNRPHIRQTIFNQRNVVFETGFVNLPSRNRPRFFVLLVHKASLAPLLLLDVNKVMLGILKSKPVADDFEMLQRFWNALRTANTKHIRFTKQELYTASKSVLARVARKNLSLKAFKAFVWTNAKLDNLRLPKASGQQAGSRREHAEQAVEDALHKFFATEPPRHV